MNKKKMAAPIITVMMVLAIFAVMAGPASAGTADLSKTADKTVYEIGETATYTLEVTNTETGDYTWTFDVYDTYAFDSPIWVATVTNLAPGSTWTDTISFTVEESDIAADGWVKNLLAYDGNDSQGKPVGSYCAEWVRVITNVTFDFTFEATGCMDVEFTGSSTGPVKWHRWDFGDGHYSAQIDGAPNAGNAVTHTYTSCGDKTVRLYGESITGESNDTVQTVHVKCGPTAKATVDPACVDEAEDMATFSASASTPGDSPIDTYQWTFSDAVSGSSDNSVTTTRPIPEDGVTATLTVTDTLDCSDTRIVSVSICPIQTPPPNVPILTPAGMIALIGLLGIVGGSRILRRGRRS